MAEKQQDLTKRPSEAGLIVFDQGLERALPSANVKIVGDLKVLTTSGTEFSGLRTFFLEPKESPVVPVLTDGQLDALNAAAYSGRTPTPKLATVPLQFAQVYTEILTDLSNRLETPNRVTPFRLLVSRACRQSMITLGSIRLDSPQPIGKSRIVRSSSTELFLEDPDLVRQAGRFSEETTTEVERDIRGVVLLRLFPPGMGRLIYAYEKGYYVDGNMGEWKELTYNNRYVEPDTLSFDQLQAAARGEKPYPALPYLDKSVFDGMTAEEIKLELLTRESGRNTMQSTRAEFFRQYSGGDFDETSYNPNIQRDGDPNIKHTHIGVNTTIWS